MLAVGLALVAYGQAPPDSQFVPVNLGESLVTLPGEPGDQAGSLAGSDPKVLRDPLEPAKTLRPADPVVDLRTPFIPMPADAPHGYTGPSGILPREQQSVAQFEPVKIAGV